MAKKLTANKAKEILHDKSVHGHPLTDKQRRFFGAIAGGAPIQAEQGGWLDKYGDEINANEGHSSAQENWMGEGYSNVGRDYSPAWGGQFQKGGKLTAEQLDSLNKAKMKAKMALASEFGNPAARRMTSAYPSTYRFTGNEMINGESVGVPAGEVGTHYMGSMGEYAVPYIQQNASGNLQFNPNASPDDREAMRFDNPQDAEYFAEHYKEVAPMMRNFAMGGSLPGAVGFTYARTGGIPSNGPYAKKTKASAQNGDKYSKNKEQVVNQLSNLPIYSPDVRYSEYKGNVEDWKKNLEGVQIEENPNLSEVTGFDTPGSYFDKSMPSPLKEYPYAGTVQLDPNKFNEIDTRERVLGHELTHGAFDGSGFIPNWYADNLKNTARNPEGKEHQDLLSERAAQTMGVRRDIVNKYGLKPDAKIPKELYDSYLRDHMNTDIRTGTRTESGELKESLFSARNASNLYNLLNMENIPKQENGGMTYYQHGLDWKPKSMQTGGWLDKYAPSESTSIGTPRRDAELLDQLAKRKQFEKYITNQPQLKQATKSTPAQEKERIRKNKEYASKLPNAKVDEQGNVSRINPNRSVTGEAENFMSRREDKAAEHALGALEAAGYAEGLGALGSAAKKAVAQSMESGLLSNTYKLNPWAFKPNPEAYYRGIGKEGLDDILESGIVRSKKQHAYPEPYFSKGVIGDKYAKGYFAELTNEPMKGVGSFPEGSLIQTPANTVSVSNPNLKLYKQDWLRGYKEVPKPITETLPPPQQAGFPNPLAIADKIIPMPLNPQRLIGMSGSWMDLSPLNILPFYGEKLVAETAYPRIVGFRKFGNSIQDVIDRQALSPKGRTNPFGGKSAFTDEGNWAAVGSPDETYKGLFEATMNPQIEGSNIQLSKIGRREGVVGTTKEGDVDIPLTDPGLSFNRRLPFSTRYVPIDKQKLIDNKFQLATFAPHLQSLAEKYAVGLGGAAALGAMGYPNAVEKYNQYTIDPLKEQWKNFQNTDIYKKGKELDQSVGLNFLYDKKKEGGVIEDDMGQWAHPGKITKINSNQITMKGVDYPVLGVSDEGDTQMMYPDQEYTFKGKTVTEYPQKKKKGGWLDKYN